MNALIEISLTTIITGVAIMVVIAVVLMVVELIYDIIKKCGGIQMEKKIINLIKETEGGTCLLCCEREATVKVEINRVKYNDNVIGFHVCDKCLSVMQQDIQKICE